MKKNIVRLTEEQLHQIIKESVNKLLNERFLDKDEKFTPYTEKEAEINRKAYMWGTPEQRNPSYAEALRKARMNKKA